MDIAKISTGGRVTSEPMCLVSRKGEVFGVGLDEKGYVCNSLLTAQTTTDFTMSADNFKRTLDTEGNQNFFCDTSGLQKRVLQNLRCELDRSNEQHKFSHSRMVLS